MLQLLMLSWFKSTTSMYPINFTVDGPPDKKNNSKLTKLT